MAVSNAASNAATQKMIDEAVQAALKDAGKGLVTASSKPDQIKNLKKTWRKSAEHKAEQVKRFIGALGGVVVAQLISDEATGKNPLTHFTDAHTAWYFLLPFALVAWRQVHPSMTAAAADSAPGVTIVPDQVGAQTVDVPVDNAQVEVAIPEDTSSPDASTGDAAP